MKKFLSFIVDIFTGRHMDQLADDYVNSRNPQNEEERSRLYSQFWLKASRRGSTNV